MIKMKTMSCIEDFCPSFSAVSGCNSGQNSAHWRIAVYDIVVCGLKQLPKLSISLQIADVHWRPLERDIIYDIRILQLQSVLFRQIVAGCHMDLPPLIFEEPHQRFMELSDVALYSGH